MPPDIALADKLPHLPLQGEWKVACDSCRRPGFRWPSLSQDVRRMVATHLTAKMDGISADSLLADWRHLVPQTHSPVLMTALGDLFMRDEAGAIHFLDLMCGQLKQVARSQDEFDSLCDNREQRQRWFVGHLVMELRKRHGDLPAGQCFSCKVPLFLSGQLESDNFQPCDVQVHYSVLGQLHAQTRHLPAGTRVDSVATQAADDDTKSKKSWWRRFWKNP